MTKKQKYLSRVASLGCLVCRRLGIEDTPASIHHVRLDVGMAQRSEKVLPICYEHHQGDIGIHGLGTRGFIQHYGFGEADLLEDLERLL